MSKIIYLLKIYMYFQSNWTTLLLAIGRSKSVLGNIKNRQNLWKPTWIPLEALKAGSKLNRVELERRTPFPTHSNPIPCRSFSWESIHYSDCSFIQWTLTENSLLCSRHSGFISNSLNFFPIFSLHPTPLLTHYYSYSDTRILYQCTASNHFWYIPT